MTDSQINKSEKLLTIICNMCSGKFDLSALPPGAIINEIKPHNCGQHAEIHYEFNQ